MKYRIPVDSYVVVEADTVAEAMREIEAQIELPYVERSGHIESDLLSNATLGTPSLVEE